MARATKQSKQIRKQYSAEYTTEALALAARVGVAANIVRRTISH